MSERSTPTDREMLAVALMNIWEGGEPLSEHGYTLESLRIFLAEKHDGDCTRRPYTCNHCVADIHLNYADKIINALSLSVRTPAPDGEPSVGSLPSRRDVAPREDATQRAHLPAPDDKEIAEIREQIRAHCSGEITLDMREVVGHVRTLIAALHALKSREADVRREERERCAKAAAVRISALANMCDVLRRIQDTLARHVDPGGDLQDPMETVNALLDIADHRETLAMQRDAIRALSPSQEGVK
jgi:hypothetical protein